MTNKATKKKLKKEHEELAADLSGFKTGKAVMNSPYMNQLSLRKRNEHIRERGEYQNGKNWKHYELSKFINRMKSLGRDNPEEDAKKYMDEIDVAYEQQQKDHTVDMERERAELEERKRKKIEDRIPVVKSRAEFEKLYDTLVDDEIESGRYEPAWEYFKLIIVDAEAHADDYDDYEGEWGEIEINIGYHMFKDYPWDADYEILESIEGEYYHSQKRDELIHEPKNRLVKAVARELLKTPVGLLRWSEKKSMVAH